MKYHLREYGYHKLLDVNFKPFAFGTLAEAMVAAYEESQGFLVRVCRDSTTVNGDESFVEVAQVRSMP